MRPETGNNNPSADNSKVSIRLESGGHSFSADALPDELRNPQTEALFEVVTHKTLLIPSELFERDNAARYLAVAGLACRPDETALTAEKEGMTAVMAVSSKMLNAIRPHFGERAAFTSPLLELENGGGRELRIALYGDVSYFKLSDDGRLRFAEALRTVDFDEILYCLHILDERFGLAAYHIYICGDGAADTAARVKKYFRKVKCE